MSEKQISKGLIWSVAGTLLFIVAAVYSFTVPEAGGFQKPDAARIIFWHVPFAIFSNMALLASSYFGYRYLSKKRAVDGARLVAAWEIAVVNAVIGLLTGIVFSELQWGAWWHWDARQTTFLLVVLLLLAGQALQAGFKNRQSRRSTLAGYALISLVPTIFLTFIYPRLPQVKAESLHPSTTIAQGGLDSNYRTGLYLMALAIGILCTVMISYRSRLDLLEESLEKLDGELETFGNGAADHRGTGPVVVSKKS